MGVLLAAGDPDRRDVSQRLDSDVVHAVVLAFKGDVSSLQQLHRGLQDLVSACAALLARASSGLELWRVPTGSDPVDEATAAQVLQGGDLFGKHHRLPCRQYEDRGAELHAAGD